MALETAKWRGKKTAAASDLTAGTRNPSVNTGGRGVKGAESDAAAAGYAHAKLFTELPISSATQVCTVDWTPLTLWSQVKGTHAQRTTQPVLSFKLRAHLLPRPGPGWA